jgi:hypothetical protein
MAPLSFIIRIYRLPAERAGPLTGLVEVVDTGERHGFSTIDQLWRVISRTHSRRRQTSNTDPGDVPGE